MALNFFLFFEILRLPFVSQRSITEWRWHPFNWKLPVVRGLGSSFVPMHSVNDYDHFTLFENVRCQRERVEEGWDMWKLHLQLQNIGTSFQLSCTSYYSQLLLTSGCALSCITRCITAAVRLCTSLPFHRITLFHPFSLTAQYEHSGRKRQNKGKVQGYNFSHTFSDHSQLLPKNVSFYDLAARTKQILQSTRYREFTIAIVIVFIRSCYLQREAGNVCNYKFPWTYQ